jgi:hypothetical protein
MFGSLSRAVIFAIIVTSALTACGGGGGSYSAGTSSTSTSASTVTTIPSGGESTKPILTSSTVISSVFDGKNDLEQPVTTLIQDDGSFFMVYSDTASGNVIGVSVGKGSLMGGSFSSTEVSDLSMVGTGAQVSNPAIFSASYSERQSLDGTLTYAGNNQTRTFTTHYNSSYETLPNLATLSGTYKGSIATKDLREQDVELTIAADGTLTGKLSCGCTVYATLVPHPSGIAYDATLDFTGGSHELTGNTLIGNVYFDSTTKRLYIVGQLTAPGNSAIFVGTKT